MVASLSETVLRIVRVPVLSLLIMLGFSGVGTPHLSGQITACSDVDLNLQGQRVFLMEPQGVGKTVLLTDMGRYQPVPIPLGGDADITARCITALLEGVDPVEIPPQDPDDQTADPGYIVFDYNDIGAYIPIGGISTGFPVRTGVVSAAAIELVDKQQEDLILVMALDKAEQSIRRALTQFEGGEGRSVTDTGTGAGLRAGSMAARATETAGEMREAAPPFVSFHGLSAVSLSVFDEFGGSAIELRCERGVKAWAMDVPSELARSALANHHATDVELVFVACEGGFDRY